MNDFYIIILTGVVSIITSIITALITLSITHKNEVKKLVLEKRAELYFKFYDEAEHLLHDRFKTYDSSYIQVLLDFKPKMKLLSSTKTEEAFKAFYEFVIKNYEEYRSFYIKNDPQNNPGFFETEFNEYGEEYEICHVTDMDILCFESRVENFKRENIPSTEIFKQHIAALYTEMRKDLGSNMKR
ncbi:MAG: hypothetical protein IJB86_07845 [Clostridia bacterium]|nr:hypothetical protein [Clostridia bacterium]